MDLVRFALLAMPVLLAAQQPAEVSSPQIQPQAATTQPTKPEDKCVIEGQVLSLVTGEQRSFTQGLL